MTGSRNLLREIPSVDALLGEPAAVGLLSSFGREAVVGALREVCAALRDAVREGTAPEDPALWRPRLLADAGASLQRRFAVSLRRVINATGVVLHTNLGRAPLAAGAIQAVAATAGRYCNLEYDLAEGTRGHRSDHVAALLVELTGAEAACVVNNNAAAMLLILDAFARGREVVVARSELIEIGGAFRLPDVLVHSGATLVEVGTTNRVYLSDYERVIHENTALLLKTHPSNFRIVGFTHDVAAADMAALGRARGIATCMDLGSGVLVDLARWGLPAEPTVAACVAAGLDLVCFSGDKLLGGPQAGIIVGRAEAVTRCARHPLMRALRCDKMTLAALEATLAIYRRPAALPEALPTLALLTRPIDVLESAARSLADVLAPVLQQTAQVAVRTGHSLPGGGSLPTCEVPTWLVAVRPHQGNEAIWAESLRRGDPAVLLRVEGGELLFDVRTLLPGDEAAVVSALARQPERTERSHE